METKKNFKEKKEFISKSPDETSSIGKDLAKNISSLPCLIGLEGEMGAGKTVFAKGFASGLDVKELVTSPTFLGISEYYSGTVPFIHMDFYKKVTPEHLIKKFLDKSSIVLIEWVNNFSEVYNDNLKTDIRILIENTGENERKITINYT